MKISIKTTLQLDQTLTINIAMHVATLPKANCTASLLNAELAELDAGAGAPLDDDELWLDGPLAVSGGWDTCPGGGGALTVAGGDGGSSFVGFGGGALGRTARTCTRSFWPPLQLLGFPLTKKKGPERSNTNRDSPSVRVRIGFFVLQEVKSSLVTTITESLPFGYLKTAIISMKKNIIVTMFCSITYIIKH